MALQVINPRRFYGLVFIGIVIVSFITWKLAWGTSQLQQGGEFTIRQGASSRQVWRELESAGYTSRTLPWKYYSWRQEAADKIQAGTYQLAEGEHVKDVVRRLVAGDTQHDQLTLIFPEGFTLKQIADRTAARGIGSADQFMAAASDLDRFSGTFPFLTELAADRTLEGYLFPDTYRVFADDEPEDVIRRMLATFDQRVVQAGLPAQAMAEAGRTLDDIVNMASIIEREVQTDDDMAIVAGILWKRLDEGMGLDVDATVRYALDKPQGALTMQDLAVDSLYNTRRYRGLPPGPISSPGLRALMAAVRPEASEYYYYLSAPSGETIFARTNDEHNVNKARHLR